MTLQTEPVLGLDKVHPIEYHNVPFPPLRDSYHALRDFRLGLHRCQGLGQTAKEA